MASETDQELAYAAGQAAASEPIERRGVEACPFSEGTDERESWLQGFEDALGDQTDLLRSIRGARSDA
jgi:ribosome modulation factor